jgi:hypothetical protein
VLRAAPLLVLLACQAPPPEGDDDCAAAAPLVRAVLGGTIDDAHPAVVSIASLDATCQRAGTPVCTGTLVAPDVVLTAAHCVAQTAPERVAVVVSDHAEHGPGPLGQGLEGALFLVAAIELDPRWDDATDAFDLATLRLVEPASVAPVPVLPAGSDALVAGAFALVVGFGPVEGDPLLRKRQGTVVLADVGGDELRYEPAPAMTCAGDSGGPVLVEVEGVEHLAAVTSRGDTACAAYGLAPRVDGWMP